MPDAGRHRAIGEILLERRLISPAQLDAALGLQRQSGEPLGKIIISQGYIGELEFMKALGHQVNMPLVDLENLEIPAEVLAKVPGSVARMYGIVPLDYSNKTLTVATADPLNFSVFDDLRFLLDAHIKGTIASETAISRALYKYYPAESESVDKLFNQFTHHISETDVQDLSVDVAALADAAGQLPIIKLINMILAQAIERRASDIHFEPFADVFKVRFRLDGVLYDVLSPPKTLHAAIASRIKVLSNLNIAEARLPQDGRTLVRISNRTVDLRVSTLPTIFGESVVIRILDKAAVQLSLDQVGFNQHMREQFRELIRKPHGIILSTGPTGCGKTTTQYAALTEINTAGVKIITVEDPVEFDLPGLIQVAVKPGIGLTFPVALRSILRQDPDIIMIGEIRDAETVQMAVHASLTGHLVFSTLHTNDAPTAITRLLDMGVEPFLIVSTMESILAQRLVRCICSSCRRPQVYTAQEISAFGVESPAPEGMSLYSGQGCAACNGSGYRGRVGIFELMIFDEGLRSLILERAPVTMLRDYAVKNGMRTLRQDGWDKVVAGLITPQELAGTVMGYL